MNAVRKTIQLAGRVAKLLVTRPSRLTHLMGCALYASEEVADHRTDLLRLRSVAPEELLPRGEVLERISLALFPRTHASLSVLEWICLVLLLKKAQARSVFEFGTYKGVSITQLALNLSPDSRIHTLDLPDEPSPTRFAIADPEDAVIAREAGKGALVPAELRPRIRFLRQDSAQLDESAYAEQVDFVFVDGAHNYDYVRNDSEKGWRMLRQGGIVAWHDCRTQDPAVVRYLLESPFDPVRISGTTLAFAIKP